MTNLQRKDAELPYIFDQETARLMKQSRMLLNRLNKADYTDYATIRETVAELLGGSDETTMINPPFYCDYGKNIFVGKNFFANFNCTILDVAKVTIGNNCFLAPGVGIYTAGHPIHPEVRNTGLEYGIGITIGNDVWIGAQSVICPGVHIGSGVVIGAGSVVTHDIPDMVVAAGNPCRVLRPITEQDKQFYFKDRPLDEFSKTVLKNAQQ
ncbi:MAG: sugar O-acetyltransferase [Clostridia bacterium]|nr:sugar O-acetyltransferase [Clostridia bacterium]MBQ5362917.1 sugar O-acetyltransferase [Clostridia bacterium]MBQ5792682.1 sugar O-acetyltransferase [Clostridia bacterium]